MRNNIFRFIIYNSIIIGLIVGLSVLLGFLIGGAIVVIDATQFAYAVVLSIVIIILIVALICLNRPLVCPRRDLRFT